MENNITLDLKETGRESVDLGEGQVVGCCKDGSEPSSSIKFGKCLEHLRIYKLLRQGCAVTYLHYCCY